MDRTTRDYTTRDGDTADVIAHREMGGAGRVMALLESNRHVAQFGATLPAGLALAPAARAARPRAAPARAPLGRPMSAAP